MKMATQNLLKLLMMRNSYQVKVYSIFLGLVEVFTVADVSDEDCVGNSLLQIWKLRFGHKA